MFLLAMLTVIWKGLSVKKSMMDVLYMAICRIGPVSVVWEIVGHVYTGFGCEYGTDFGNLSQYLYLYQGIVLKINESTKGKSYCFDCQAGYHQYQL